MFVISRSNSRVLIDSSSVQISQMSLYWRYNSVYYEMHGCAAVVQGCCLRALPSLQHSPSSPSLCKTTADIMDDELMFAMEEEGSANRLPVQRRAPKHRASSLSDANGSDDEDEDHFICPILDDPSGEICHYLKNIVNTRQLSNSLPKTNFLYKVRCCSDGKCTAKEAESANVERERVV